MTNAIAYLILLLISSMSSLSQINEFKLLPSDGAAKDLFGTSVSISTDYAIVGSTYGNDSTGAAYVFRREGAIWVEEQRLVASDGAKGDRFGGLLKTVSISGDYAIVGAPYSDTLKGSAYIFKRDGTDWIEQKLQTSDGAQGIGTSTSISDKYAVISALDNDSIGSVYVFRRDGIDWIEEQKLQASNDSSHASFGAAVSISGDYIIVGAPDFKGSAYIFKREETGWLEEQKLTASGEDTLFNWFGISVSISGTQAVVGSFGSLVNGIHSGAAYIFSLHGNCWTEDQKLFPSDYTSNDWFGLSVSISNGYTIIGSHYNDDNGSASGSAYIFRQQTTNWVEEQKLTASDADTGDTFGVSVSISGDYVIVGAHGNDDNGENSGSAYIYTGFVVSVENEQTEIPHSLQLNQNYPNPFNPSTKISWQSPVGSWQTLKIFDVLGNEVATLVDEYKPAGTYEVEFNSHSGSVRNLPSGIYFYQLKTENFIETKKMILIK
jgi:hypothetical protein